MGDGTCTGDRYAVDFAVAVELKLVCGCCSRGRGDGRRSTVTQGLHGRQKGVEVDSSGGDSGEPSNDSSGSSSASAQVQCVESMFFRPT